MQITERQLAVLRALIAAQGAASTTWIARAAKLSTVQAAASCRQMDSKGLVERYPSGSVFWRASTSGVQWLRYFEAGRPWLIRGHAR